MRSKRAIVKRKTEKLDCLHICQREFPTGCQVTKCNLLHQEKGQVQGCITELKKREKRKGTALCLQGNAIEYHGLGHTRTGRTARTREGHCLHSCRQEEVLQHGTPQNANGTPRSRITDTQSSRYQQRTALRGVPERASHCCTHTAGRSRDACGGAPWRAVAETWGLLFSNLAGTHWLSLVVSEKKNCSVARCTQVFIIYCVIIRHPRSLCRYTCNQRFKFYSALKHILTCGVYPDSYYCCVRH